MEKHFHYIIIPLMTLRLNGNNKDEHEKEGQKWVRIDSLNQDKKHQTMVCI
jgi:hypothetical protein